MIFLKKIKAITIKLKPIIKKGIKLFRPILSMLDKFVLSIDKVLSNINNTKFQNVYSIVKKIGKYKHLNLILLFSLLIGITIVNVNKSNIKITEVLEKKVVIHRELKENQNIIKVYDHRNKELIELPLEEYLYGVVAGEIGSEFQEEAIKAQSIAARTFTANIIMNKTKKHTSGAHICTDYKHCQEYKPSKITNKIKKAVNDTKGEIATYDNKPINALYHSMSSGKTENAKDIWGSTYPYLLSVDSKYEEKIVNINSSVKKTKEQLITLLGVTFTDSPLEEQIKILSRTEGGSVNKIKVGNATFSGLDFRTKLKLRSANFTISFSENTIIFNVKGFGHGVGMSQYGANGMAKEGFKYQDILKHYYTDIEVINLY